MPTTSCARELRFPGTVPGTFVSIAPAPEGVVLVTEQGGGPHPARLTPMEWTRFKEAGDRMVDEWFERHG
ncbi:MAG TPA: hypothetical protein VHC22_32575 [Pirellulales bacterium]|nr:hypothetical protein [Pirellulales bacterium]